jgi:hypothetical protein
MSRTGVGNGRSRSRRERQHHCCLGKRKATSPGQRNDRRTITRRNTMLRSRWFVPIALTATTLVLCSVGPARSAGNDADFDPAAMKSIERMSDFIAGAKQYGVAIDVAYDVVQEWGQKLEFGESRAVTVRRPDRLRVETTDRDGSVSGVVFDGREITAFNVNDKVYATTPHPGTLDDAIAYFVDDLDMRLPMASILQGRIAKDAKGWARNVRYVDQGTIAGVPCDHVALHGDWEDVQLWIARGDKPLLQRLVITYTRAEGKPQFSAQLRDWNLSPNAADAVFAFTPPAGAAKIGFKPRRIVPGTVSAGGGGQP